MSWPKSLVGYRSMAAHRSVYFGIGAQPDREPLLSLVSFCRRLFGPFASEHPEPGEHYENSIGMPVRTRSQDRDQEARCQEPAQPPKESASSNRAEDQSKAWKETHGQDE